MPSTSDFDLLLNAAPVLFDREAVIKVGHVEYEDETALSTLRNRLRQTHFVRRAGDSIQTVPFVAGVPVVGDSDDVRAGDAHGLVSALCLESLLRHFVGLGRDVRSHRPVRLVSARPSDNVLRSVLPSGVAIPDWLARWVVYEVGTRLVFKDGNKPLVVLAIGVGTQSVIDATCRTLLGVGVPLERKYVQIVNPGDDPRLAERRHLAGQVVSVDGNRLLLEDHAEGRPYVGIDEAYLEPRTENLGACLRALLGKKTAEPVMRRLHEASGTIAGGPSRLERAEALFSYLRKQPLELVPGLRLHFGPMLHLGDGEFPHHRVMVAPGFLFDPAGRKPSHGAQNGLDSHGPYDRNVFSPKKPRIAVICQAQHQGRVEQFVETFLEGHHEGPFSKGLLRRFHLDRPEVQVFRTSSPTARGYQIAVEEAISSAADRGFRWHLALVQIEDTFRELHADKNPYLICKAMLLRHQVAVQEVTLRTMTLQGSQAGYALNNLSLATYAKLGGIPWVLPADPTISHELVIGLGSYQVAGSRLGGRERYVGLTTVFTGDGRYRVDGRTSVVPFEGYQRAMLDVIRRAIESVREEDNWKASAPVRLVFHAFKPMKDAEISAVRDLMKELALPHAEFAFLHLAEDHPFALLNRNELGANAQGGGKKGTYSPPRGLYVRFGDRDCLVAFKGAKDVKRPSDGLPLPVLLHLHQASTFTDLTYLSQQAFAFSTHSWRSFFPAPMPITIVYSRLIAGLLSQLQQVDGWANDSMLGRVGRTRWFL